MSFKLKTVLGIALIEGILLAYLAWTTLSALSESNENALKTRGESMVQFFATTTKDAVLSSDLASLETFVAEMLKNEGVIYARVLDDTGASLAEGGVQAALGREFIIDSDPSDVLDQSYDVGAPISEAGVEFGYVQLGLSVDILQEVIRSARSRTLTISLVEMGLVALFSLLLGTYLTRQLDALSDASKRIAKGDFDHRIEVNGKDELAQTAMAFNKMGERLSTSVAEMRNEEIRKTALLDSALDAVIAIDRHGDITDFNPAAERCFGFARDDILGKSMCEHIIPEELRAAHQHGMQRFLQTGTGDVVGKRIEITALRANGDRFPVELTVNSALIDGEPLFTAFLRDITDRIRLEKNQNRLRMAVESSTDAILITDPQGFINYANPAWSTQTGWDAADTHGKHWQALLGEGATQEIREAQLEVLFAEGAWSGRSLVPKRAVTLGATDTHLQIPAYWAQTNVAAIKTDGEVEGYVAVLRDISEVVGRERRDDLEREATNARAEISATLAGREPVLLRFEQVIRYLSSLDSMRNDDGAVFVLLDEFAIDVEEIEHPQGVVDLIPRHVANRARQCTSIELLDNADGSPSAQILGHYVVPIMQGRERFGAFVLTTNGVPSDDKPRIAMLERTGEQMGLAVVNERLDQEMEKARYAAEEAAKTKAQFLANMSHEIRTPMNGVIGMLDILRSEKMPSSQHRYVNLAHTSATGLLHIINDVLDFSRVESGRLDLEVVEFDLYETLDRLVETLRHSVEQKGLELLVHASPQLPDYIFGDPHRVYQVLLNLVSNAIKFTAEGSVVVRVIVRDADKSNVTLLLEIEDTGIGIPTEAQRKLFQPFSQADGSTSREYGGTGLGLAICRQIVELMDGELSVRSTPGMGATFWFEAAFGRSEKRRDGPRTLTPQVLRMPAIEHGVAQPAVATDPAAVAQNDEEEREHTDSSAPTLRGKVLLAEDNVINQIVAQRMLGDLGIDVDLVDDGAKAVEQAYAKDYDLILMDCQMPRLDGFDATRAIRRYEAERELEPRPIYALTANVMQSDRDACREAGMTGHLAKPYELTVLHATLAQYLKPAEVADVLASEELADCTNTEEGTLVTDEPTVDAMIEMEEEPILDNERAARMAEVLGDKFAAVTSSFEDEARKQIDSLVAAIESGDRKQAIADAHQLRGTSGNLGAAALSECCAVIEQGLSDDEAFDARPHAAKLARIFELSVEAFHALTEPA